MRVLALFRVSTERQANEGASLDAQARKFRELASAQRWAVVGEFRGCESATMAASERRVLQQVLAAIRAEKPDGIYVHEQSRLTRGDELEVALLLRELRENNVKIIVSGIVRDLSSIDERFMVSIQSLVDRAESERIKERHARGKQEKAKQGKKNCGPAALGYRNPPPGAPNRGVLQIVPQEASLVRRIFELSASGLSDEAVAVALNRDALPSPRGSSWGKTTIGRILNNPAYLGVHVTRGWVTGPGPRTFRWQPSNPRAIWVEGAHEAIIPRELWLRVHGRTKRPCTAKPRLLTGFLWVDGIKYGPDSTGGIRYYCDTKSPGKPWLEADPLDAALWDGLVRCLLSPELVEEIQKQTSSKSSSESVTVDIVRLESQLARQRKRLTGLVDMRADGELGREEYLSRSEALRKSIQQAEVSLREVQRLSARVDPRHANESVQAIRLLLQGSTRLDVAQKRQVMGSVVRRLDVKSVRTHHRQLRGAGGQLAAASGPRWAVAEASATLTFRSNAAKPDCNRCGDLDTAC